MKNFRTYQLSIQFYRATSKAPVPGHLRNQLLRAASSFTLNLGEGYGRIQNGAIHILCGDFSKSPPLK